jgi:hypothetical protein
MKKKIEKEQLYVVLDSYNQVFAGFRYGEFYFSSDWSEYQPVRMSGTKYLKSKINELIKEQDFII